jgi:hypothetical protein
MIEQLVKEKRESALLSEELEKCRTLGNAAGAVKNEKSLHKKIKEINERIAKVQKLGVVLKDIDLGLIDFPADRFGENVMLCWRLGEAEVSYWHTIYEGYAGRKPLSAGP